MKRSREKIQRNSKDDCDHDRISNLPKNIIDLIMELLSVRDAAQTCVLSTKWRYVWADHPTVVVDGKFWDVIKGSESTGNVTDIDFASIVHRILLSHRGTIQKFVVDISVINSQQHNDINLWLSLLCRMGVKVLFLMNSTSNIYIIPSCVFFAPELTSLDICHCVIKAKENITGFGRLQSLYLYRVALESCVLTTPLLISLSIQECQGIRNFYISAPKIESLDLVWNDYFNLKPYLICKSMQSVFLFMEETNEDPEAEERVNLVQLWPRISSLVIDSICLKYLATGNVPDILELNLRWVTLYDIILDREQLAWILCILKNSPRLDTFEIWFAKTTNLEEANDIDEPSNIDYRMEQLDTVIMISNMDYRLEQLDTVMMKHFTASRVQIWFAKILLRNSPMLKELLVEEDVELDANERLEILKKLLLLQRERRTADIKFGENLVPDMWCS